MRASSPTAIGTMCGPPSGVSGTSSAASTRPSTRSKITAVSDTAGRSLTEVGRRAAPDLRRDMAAGLGIGLGRLLSVEDGTASEEEKLFYRSWLSRIEGWSVGAKHIEMERVKSGSRFR